MKSVRPSLIELAVVAFCIWQAYDLPSDWVSFPFLRLSWLSFVIWFLPIPIYWIFPINSQTERRTTPILFWIALILSVLGMLGSLHALQHLGVAFALMGLVSWTWWSFIWLASCVSWMPAMSYFASNLSLDLVLIARVIVAFIGMTAALVGMRRENHE